MVVKIGKFSPFLWVALDGFSEDKQETEQLLRSLNEVEGNFGFKFNGDALYKYGADYFKRLAPERKRFGDIKMWNGARTMARTFRVYHEADFDAVNVWALAGGRPDEDGKGAELKRAVTMFRKEVGETMLQIYGLTVLSHYTDRYCMDHFGRRMDVQVRLLIDEAVQGGCDRIILPGTQLKQVEDISIPKMVTGLRPDWYRDDNEHAQTLLPAEIAGRIDLETVCGKPLTEVVGEEPERLERLLSELQK